MSYINHIFLLEGHVSIYIYHISYIYIYVYTCVSIYIYITYYGAFLHSICIYIDMRLEYVSDWISWALGPFLIEVRSGKGPPAHPPVMKNGTVVAMALGKASDLKKWSDSTFEYHSFVGFQCFEMF